MKKIKIGLIGAGGNTVQKHIPGFLKIPGVEIVAIANRTRESAQKVAQQFNIPHSVNKRDNTQLVQINGGVNVTKFLKNIGFSNPRSLNKVRYLTS